MDLKIKKSLYILPLLLLSSANAALPIYPAEILGRNMQQRHAEWLGHVGIATAPYIYQDAYQVLEVLKDDQHVIQLNLITDFKSRTKYWGSRYGIADRGDRALLILREGNFQRDLDCTDYTILAGYEPSQGYYDFEGKPHCTARGQFRCDTYVYYLFGVGGYNLPVSSVINPTRIFNSFPKGNGDGPYAPELTTNSIDSNEVRNRGINRYNNDELSSMPISDFYRIVDMPNEKVNKKMQDRLLNLAKNNNLLSSSKRSIILNKISFVGGIDNISELIDLFNNISDKNVSLKNQVLSTVQHVFDNQCSKTFKPQCNVEKERVLLFYNDIVQRQTKIKPLNANIVVRGLINLSKKNEIISSHEKINQYINNKNINFDARSKLTLKLDLMSVSSSLEPRYISEIISLLNIENDPDLDGTFNRYIVARLSRVINGGFSLEDREQIKIYLEDIKSQHDHIEVSQQSFLNTKLPGMFDYGSWLEAYALINSNSHEEAAKHIANFIKELKTEDEKKQFIIGLSNSDYMKNAFSHEQVLKNFKKNNKDIYMNTVGIPQKTHW
jgi:hypothetical protein